MTRINIIPPMLLTDQHLIAEKKEINQLAGQFYKSIRSSNFDINLQTYTKYKNKENRSDYVLGMGHVWQFYDRGAYIRKRYDEVTAECVKRYFSVTYDFNDVWLEYPKYDNDWKPNKKAYRLIIDRITDKIEKKNFWYRYHGKPIQKDVYLQMLENWYKDQK